MVRAPLSLRVRELLERRALPHIIERGRDYFGDGAVRDLRRGPTSASALVDGSGLEPYRVSLDWSGGTVQARCSCPYDWSEVCKHALALAFALEPAEPAPAPAKPLLQAVPDAPAEPPADPVAEAREKELEARVRSSKSEPMHLENQPRGLYGEYRLRSIRSDARYTLLLLGPEFAWCSCADLRTSELPRCKHLEFVLRTRKELGGRPRAQKLAVLASADTTGRLHSPLMDIRLYHRGPLRPSLARCLDEHGFVVPTLLGARPLSKLRSLFRAEPKLEIRPEVEELLRRLESLERDRVRRGIFEKQVRRSRLGQGPAPAEWARLLGELRLPLHPYQVEGVLFATRTPRGLLADDMGLGKTFQATAAIRLLQLCGEVQRALIVCPASLKYQWAREAGKLLGDALQVEVIEGGRKARAERYRHTTAVVLVLNYETLIKDLPLLRALAPELVVLDEAQRIKNWNTKTAKAVKGLRTPRALVLTGTPMENRLSELHSVAEYLDERHLGPMWRLGPEFAITDPSDERPRVAGFRGLDLIRRRLAPRMLRRERASVLSQLPARTDLLVPVPFTPEQAAPHAEHAQTAARIAAKRHLTEVDILRLMAELQSMRMIANGLLLYDWKRVEKQVRRGELTAAWRSRLPSPKLTEFESVLEELLAQKDTKVVVFSQWERMLRLAAAGARTVLEEAKVRPVFFHGQLSSRERAEAITEFHDDPAARVFFSTDAGAVGLNLQEAANTLIHLEIPWNPAVLEQRVGRIHRMGQKRPIQVISLVTENSIEARIAQVVEQKRALFDGLFRGETDEVRFDDESRGTLVDRMRELLGGVEGKPTLPSQAVIEQRRAIDEEVTLVTTEVAELTTTPAAAPAAPSAPLQLDLGALANGLLGLLGAAPASAVPPLPVSIRREGDRLVAELPAIPEAAWEHLRRFAESLKLPPTPG